MVDHHVDRPDVEVQQCMKLTGTNPSIGLILPGIRFQSHPGQREIQTTKTKTPQHPLSFNDLVAMARDLAPDPIPNSAVKTLSADGTAS